MAIETVDLPINSMVIFHDENSPETSEKTKFAAAPRVAAMEVAPRVRCPARHHRSRPWPRRDDVAKGTGWDLEVLGMAGIHEDI